MPAYFAPNCRSLGGHSGAPVSLCIHICLLLHTCIFRAKLPFSRWSFRRPGVAMTMSGFFLSAVTSVLIFVPPTITCVCAVVK